MELVAQEEMGLVAPDTEQPASFRRPTEIDSADHPEGLIALAFEDGRDGQEQLIDAIVAYELPKELGTAFGKNGAIAVSMERIEDVIDVDQVAIGKRSHFGGLR